MLNSKFFMRPICVMRNYLDCGDRPVQPNLKSRGSAVARGTEGASRISLTYA